MKHPPPWWLRFPIYLDWIQLSQVIIVFVVVLAYGGRIRLEVGQIAMILGAAPLLIALDALGGLGHAWALLPRAGLAFMALLWCGREITWQRFDLEAWLLLGVGMQQLWVLLACVTRDVGLRFLVQR